MKSNQLLLCLHLGWLVFFAGCTDTTTTDPSGNWTRKAEFEGVSRSAAAGFVIGTTAYIGTGQDISGKPLRDFWSYDPITNSWTQKATFPGKGRSGAAAFTADANGYLGTGMDSLGHFLGDFYRYNPLTNTWARIADFSGSPRRSAVGFSIYDIGFVGLGFDGTERADLWHYNPSGNTWTQKKYFGGPARTGAVALVIGNRAYVGTGSAESSNLRDWWLYDPDQDNWTQRQSIPDRSPAGSYGAGFVINGLGYLVAGGSNSVLSYNPATDSWTVKRDFEGVARSNAVGFAIGSSGYLTTGINGKTVLDDLWAFDPNP